MDQELNGPLITTLGNARFLRQAPAAKPGLAFQFYYVNLNSDLTYRPSILRISLVSQKIAIDESLPLLLIFLNKIDMQ
jgi:hypothetical protein